MISTPSLRSAAGALADPLPPLLASAERLAASFMMGEHGRRRAGIGDEFWQYRPAHEGDEARQIDWRRSARSDTHFIRQREWQAAQTVVAWVDRSASMTFNSHKELPTKMERAALLALAAAILLSRAGEKVGLSGNELPPASGEQQIYRMALKLTTAEKTEYGAPRFDRLRANSRAFMLSDFLGDLEPTRVALGAAADKGVTGAILHVLDPAEEVFPYDGRTIFESMAGELKHETLRAGDLRARYQDRLAERKDKLQAIARETGWLYQVHHTDHSASEALLWLYAALEGGWR